MLFQAFRFKYPVQSVAYKNAARALLTFRASSSFCVPCAPARSSFAAAMDDVRRARELGHVANVRLVSNSNNNQ